MFKSLSLLIIASLAVLSVRAADVNTVADISVAGDSTSTLEPNTSNFSLGSIGLGGEVTSATPDVSVVGDSTTTLTPLGPITPSFNPGSIGLGGPITSADVSVVGEWTTTANSPWATQTECYSLVETDGMTSSIPAQATVTDGTNPPGYACFLVYATGGGVVHVPLASATSVATQRNLVITVALPIIVTVLGLAAIIGAAVVIMRLRARRATASKRRWFRRPGGWVKDNAAGEMEAGTDKF